MLKGLGTAANSFVGVLVCVTIGASALVVVQWEPIWVIVRNVALSALGEPAPGLIIEGDARPPKLVCDQKTGRCQAGQNQ